MQNKYPKIRTVLIRGLKWELPFCATVIKFFAEQMLKMLLTVFQCVPKELQYLRQ